MSIKLIQVRQVQCRVRSESPVAITRLISVKIGTTGANRQAQRTISECLVLKVM